MAFGELTGKGRPPVAVAFTVGGGVEAGKMQALRDTLNNTTIVSKVSIFLGIGTISFREKWRPVACQTGLLRVF